MSSKFSLTGISDVALGRDLRKKDPGRVKQGGLYVLNAVSFFLAGVSALFLIAFQINQSVSLTWFFMCESAAFLLIPFLARQGYVKTAKMMLVIYVNAGIIILSNVFGSDAMIQAFFIPAMGLSILLFDNRSMHLRNAGIILSIASYFILDYIIFERVYVSDTAYTVIRWSVLSASFVTTWLIFNAFSEFKEAAESQTLKLLEKEKELNRELSSHQLQLEDYIRELELTKQKLERSARTKTDFLATMSHEIRTPMNAILGMVHLLKQDEPRKDQLESINILDFSSKTLLSLIDDILDFSKIEAGKIEFEKTEFDLTNLIKVITKSFETTAANKNIVLDVQSGSRIPKQLIGDPARLTQILNNLLSNSLKFTEEGTVCLRVKAGPEKENLQQFIFEVEDTGIGIETERQEKIFESFTQENTHTRRLFGGTGLGLSICKQLVELQGGRIELESVKGEGSLFRVLLEFQTIEEAEEETETKQLAQEISLKGMRVLLAEDNLVNQKVMERFMERWEVNLEIANDGKAALEKASRSHFDVILMDLQMPYMDGYEATEWIRKLDDPNFRKVPIIALTAAALKEVREKVFAAGMNDFVTKPFNPAELEMKLASYRSK